MARIPADVLARRRADNMAGFYATRLTRARTDAERADVLWDRWRALVGLLPPDQASQWIAVLVTALEAHIDRLSEGVGR